VGTGRETSVQTAVVTLAPCIPTRQKICSYSHYGDVGSHIYIGAAMESMGSMFMALLPCLLPLSCCIQGREWIIQCSYFESLGCIILIWHK